MPCLSTVKPRAGQHIVLWARRQRNQAVGVAQGLCRVFQAEVRKVVHEDFVFERHHNLVAAQSDSAHLSDGKLSHSQSKGGMRRTILALIGPRKVA